MSRNAIHVVPNEQPFVLALGHVVATPGALRRAGPLRIAECLELHARGDWGCLCDADRRVNDAALEYGDRVLSAYPIDVSRPSQGHGDNTLWIITEADRTVTTALLPEEH